MFLHKKGISVVVILSVTVSCLMAQPSKKDSISVLYSNYLSLAKQTSILADSVAKMNKHLTGVQGYYSRVDSRLERVTGDLTVSLQQVNRLTKDDLLTKEARLNTKRDQILMTALFIRSANNSFDAIDAALAQSDYLGDVTNLNNPTNTDLGFSLSTEITNIINQKLIKGNSKFNGNTSRFLAIVKQVIENPIISNITNAVPAVSSIQAVVGLVSSAIINDNKVTMDDYAAFNKEVQRYVVHYEALGKANYDFNSNIDKLRIQADALKVLLTNFTIERVKTFNPKTSISRATLLHEIISEHYDYETLNPLIDAVVQENVVRGQFDYNRILSDERLAYPFYAINQAQFIQQELESIYTEYTSTYRRYHENIKIVLQNSKTLSKEPAKIDAKAVSLEKKLEVVIHTFEKNVKIKEVNKNLQRIPSL